MIFLQTATEFDEAFAGGAVMGGLLGAIVAWVIALFVVVLITIVALYIYMSFAFMRIAQKIRTEPAWLAWIPVVGPMLIASKIAKMHWWPILLLIGFWIPVVGWILSLVTAIFFIIWMWKMFETIGKPGWWAIFYIIPILNIVWLVFIGIAAWGKSE